jgi:hypothetical protein
MSYNEACQQCHYGERQRVCSVSMLGRVVYVGKSLYCMTLEERSAASACNVSCVMVVMMQLRNLFL